MRITIRSYKKSNWIAVALTASIIASLLAISYVRANNDADVDWINQSPTVSKESDYSSQPSFAVDKCQQTNVQVYGQSNYQSLCMVQTAMGPMTELYSNWGYVQPNGYSKAYTVDYRKGGNPIIQPVPNQASGIYWSAGSGDWITLGLFYQISNHLTANLSPFLNSYSVQSPNDTPDMLFRHPNGETIQFEYGYNFSQNGRYIVANNGQGIMRINLMNPSIQFFAPDASYPYGPQIQTAISNSGRYATVAASLPDQPSYNSFKITDINTCSVPVPTGRNVIPSTVSYSSCKTIDLYPAIKQVLPSIVGINKPQFTNEHTITFVATYKENNIKKYALYSLTAGGEVKTLKSYLALGDSYSSGEGAYTYREGTDTMRNQCHQSLLSYPYILSSVQSSFADVTCSGARMQNVTKTNNDDSVQVSGGVEQDEVEQARLKYLPGYTAQKEFVADNNPEAVTISIGGNDIGFGSILEKCVHPLKHLRGNVDSSFTCYDNYEDRLEVVNAINDQFTRLRGLYEGLRDNGINGRRVYVVGYPQIAKVDGECGLNVAMNAEEVRFARDLIAYLNTVIQRAAEEAGVQYVDTQQAFEGSRLCEAASGQSAMNGFTISKSLNGGYDFKASFHPNRLGHQLLAQAIASQTQNLNKPMPAPKSKTNSINVDPGMAILQNVPKTNRTIRRVTIVSNIINKVIDKASPINMVINAKDFLTKPNAVYNLVLNSNPVNMGNYTADANGNINIAASIPVNMPTGFHTLHLYGNDMLGNPIDIQQVIYVSAEANDLDGDGVSNDNDSCVLAAQSNVDYDQDGIDDACDPLIAEAPVNPPADDIVWAENSTLTINISASQPQANAGP